MWTSKHSPKLPVPLHSPHVLGAECRQPQKKVAKEAYRTLMQAFQASPQLDTEDRSSGK